MLEVVFDKAMIVGTKEDGSVNEITKVTLREPTAGDLRGLSLTKLFSDMRVDDWSILLSRITSPSINEGFINLMSIKDYSKLTEAVAMLIEGETEKKA